MELSVAAMEALRALFVRAYVWADTRYVSFPAVLRPLFRLC
jgi:hypothetical protein